MKKIILSRDIGIDLGTATVLAHASDKGIVLREPSVVAIDKTTDRIIKVGSAAQEMLGRTPDNITALRPFKDGNVSQYDITLQVLQYFIRRAQGSTVLPPRIMISIPSDTTEVEESAILDASREAGARKTFIIRSPIAAALGAGLNINTPIGNMIVDIGGGVTEIAVISLGGIVISKTLRLGGDSFDEAIVRYVRDNYRMMIGERTAESIKKKIGRVYEHSAARVIEVKGRDADTGMPKIISLSSKEMIGATFEPMTALIDGICSVIEQTPPELVGDILHNGIMLVGGGSLLGGIDKLIERVTGIKTLVAPDPEACVALGTGIRLASLSKKRA